MKKKQSGAIVQKITFIAFKGGAGKTTSLYLMASVLNRRGVRVGLIDADENRSVVKWRNYGRTIGVWDEDNLKVYEGWDEQRLEAAFEQAEQDNLSYLLIDTHGGGSDLNQLVVLNSDLIIIPTDLGTGELDIALETMEYVMNLLKAAEMDIPAGFLLNRVPTDDAKFTVAERAAMEIMRELPAFDLRIPFSKYYKNMAGNGPLNLYADYLQAHADPTMRLRAGHSRVALTQAEPMVDEILGGVAMPEPA